MANALTRSLLFWVAFIATVFGSGRLAYLAPSAWSRLAHGILATVLTFLLIRLFLRNEKRSLVDVGLVWERGTVRRFVVGVAIGAVLIAAAVIALVSLSDLQLGRNPDAIQLHLWLATLPAILLFALMEELAFRSYSFVRLERAHGVWAAQLMTAIAFALYHVVMGWSWYVAFLGPFAWAFVFGLAAIRSGGIAMPTGIHLSLNVLQTFTGLKSEETSYWRLGRDMAQATTGLVGAETVGTLFQLAVLAGGLALTSLVARRITRDGRGAGEASGASVDGI